MAEKTEEILKHLVDEGRKKGFLTYGEMNKILEDQFLPPDKMDAIFVQLEDAGIEVLDDAEGAAGASGEKEDVESALPVDADDDSQDDDVPEPIFARSGVPEKIDDPVRMYLTQMGEIPLLTRDQEIHLAKTIEITRKRLDRKSVV